MTTKMFQMLCVAAAVVAMGVPRLGAGVVIEAGADAVVCSDSPDGNFNARLIDGSWFLEVRDNASRERISYFRFDLSPLSVDAATAELSVMAAFIQEDPATYDVWGLNDGHAGEGWDETTITWNNAPGNDTDIEGGLIPGEVTSLGSFVAPDGSAAGDIFTFSSPALVDFINADTDDQITLILTNGDWPGSETSVQLMSHNSPDTLPPTGLTYAPTLTIEEVPEPTSLIVLLSGLVGVVLCGLRRRRR